MTQDDLEAIWSEFETRVAPEEIQRARDAANPDEVVCNVCTRLMGQITEQHVQTHDMTLKEYKEAHPQAPIYPEDDTRQPGREAGFTHPDEVKQKIGESVGRRHDRGAYE